MDDKTPLDELVESIRDTVAVVVVLLGVCAAVIAAAFIVMLGGIK